MLNFADLATRPTVSLFALPSDPNAPGWRREDLTAGAATGILLDHLARDSRPRSVQAEPYGAVILDQGDERVTLDPHPHAHPKHLTARQAEDLLIVARAGKAARLALEPHNGMTVRAGVHRVPPAATSSLVTRGWLATRGRHGSVVRVSLTGVVALQWRSLKADRVPAARWAEDIAEAVVDHFAPEA